jgi:hypothetical protein
MQGWHFATPDCFYERQKGFRIAPELAKKFPLTWDIGKVNWKYIKTSKLT